MKILTDNSLTVLWNRLKKGVLNNRNYEPIEFSGKGYKVLEKNIQTINGVRKNILTSAMINKPNTIYEIRYDFDLNGEEITIPEGCVLKFNGGMLRNGNIYLNNTKLISDSIALKDIVIKSLDINRNTFDVSIIESSDFGKVLTSLLDKSPLFLTTFHTSL